MLFNYKIVSYLACPGTFSVTSLTVVWLLVILSVMFFTGGSEDSGFKMGGDVFYRSPHCFGRLFYRHLHRGAVQNKVQTSQKMYPFIY